MMEFVFIVMLAVIAWVHARLTVVSMIHRTQTPEHMLQRMCTHTVWILFWVIICYYALGDWGTWIVLYAMAKIMFLLFTNWSAVCDNHAHIKRLLADL